MPYLTSPIGDIQLECYPKAKPNTQQPWDAADLYLLDQGLLGEHPAILNDQWGALTCFAHLSGKDYFSWSDSFCSQTAILNNLANLGASTEMTRSHIVSGVPTFPSQTDTLWIQCPKSFDQLHWWLTLALEQLGPGTTVYVAGMAKHIPIKWLNWLENHNTDYLQFPIKKKARLIHFKLADTLPAMTVYKHYSGPDNLDIAALPGVFSRDHMDIGSRFFIHHLSQLPPLTGKVVDLGCGNGLLSIAALHYSQAEAINLILCDDSSVALHSARSNLLARNYDHAEYFHTDALLSVTGPVDTVLCNPPFHSGNRISTAAAERMFKQAAKIIAKQGQLLVIANRHLGYAASLKKSFANVQLLASDAKFVIYACKQPKK